jgi:hypothetical protein
MSWLVWRIIVVEWYRYHYLIWGIILSWFAKELVVEVRGIQKEVVKKKKKKRKENVSRKPVQKKRTSRIKPVKEAGGSGIFSQTQEEKGGVKSQIKRLPTKTPHYPYSPIDDSVTTDAPVTSPSHASPNHPQHD